jgi:excisionase family DNA binding protein
MVSTGIATAIARIPAMRSATSDTLHETLLTIDQVATRLGIGRSTVYRHIDQLPGFPQPVKIGAATRFRQSDVDAFIYSISQSTSEEVE